MQTIDTFIENYHIRAVHTRVDKNPNMEETWPANHYLVSLFATINGARRGMAVFYSMGLGLTREPTAADVLSCLADDAAGIENADNFADWASECGYDTDSRKAERVFKNTQRQTDDLRTFLGPAYDELLWDTERA